jgi:CPA2 family monovalent cation:H+ antiporter-2
MLGLLYEISVVLGSAALILLFCNKLQIPTVVGFLLTGVVIGPHSLGLVHNVTHVEELAEIGVILLLFTIGMEFSIREFLAMRRQVLLGGLLQMGLTAAVTWPAATLLGLSWRTGLFLGLLVALSSTAIVLKILQSRVELEAPQGRMALAVLIFQDIAVVPIMLLLPLLAGDAPDAGRTLLVLLGKGLLMVAGVVASVQFLIPRLLRRVALTRDRELFLVFIVFLCFAIAGLTAAAGLSLALGAFLAGLIISESEYSHQAVASILPFRDIFTSFFFISIGMLLDIGFFLRELIPILGAAGGILLLKLLVMVATVRIVGFPLRTALLSALALAQVGEFSFVLYKASVPYNLLSPAVYQLFLSVSVLTMVATPFVIAAGPALTRRVGAMSLPPWLVGLSPAETDAADAGGGLRNHLVIIGFGLTGRYLARAARLWEIPYVIIETNPVTIQAERNKGEPIFYGDASQDAILEHAGIGEARMAAIAISDPVAVRRITRIIRDLAPEIHIIVRTRFWGEYEALRDLGADEVIPEEFETSIEVLSRTLSVHQIPRSDIEAFIEEIRADGYRMSRNIPVGLAEFRDFQLPSVEVRRFRLEADAPADGKTVEELGLRKQYGVTLLALRREDGVVSSPGAATRLAAGDILLVTGQCGRLREAANLFHNGEWHPGKNLAEGTPESC